MANDWNMCTVLHTYAHRYANPWPIEKIKGRSATSIESRIASLEAQETKLYKEYGAENFVDFMDKIHKLFTTTDIQTDKNILQQFSMSNMIKLLTAHFETVASHIDPPQMELTIVGVDTPLTFDYKSEIGEMSGQVRTSIDLKKAAKQLTAVFGGRQLKNGKVADIAQSQVIPTIIDAIENGKATLTQGKVDDLILYRDVSRKPWPWGYTKEDLEGHSALGKHLTKQDFAEAITMVKNFILNTVCAGASPTLHSVVTQHLNQLFSQEKGEYFFFKGANWVRGVGGAMGELQMAIITDYLLQLRNSGNALQARVIGNTINEKGEMPKTDVKLFDSIGIQVKNFGVSRLKSNPYIPANVHPSEFAKYLISGAEAFEGFMANWFFNKTFRDEHIADSENLTALINQEIEALLSLAVDDALEDRLSFYLISGHYLVPGSALLAAAYPSDPAAKSIFKRVTRKGRKSEETDASFDQLVKGTEEAQDDTEFQHGFFQQHKHYAEYWSRDTGEWQPTEKNRKDYLNYINKHISLATAFKYEQFADQVYDLLL